jgi:hypothetical protein
MRDFVPPMTLQNVRANGVRMMIAQCESCGHSPPPKGCVIQHRKIFRDCPIGRRIEVLDLGDAAPAMGVGHDYTGVDREGLPADALPSPRRARARLRMLPSGPEPSFETAYSAIGVQVK